jgi:hypothetical protein
MKQAYLLPCKCGQKVEVDTTQAGLTVKCTCGSTLDVPTMRDIVRLECAGVAGSSGAKRGTSNWGPRQGYTLVGALIALIGLSWLGYQLWTMPEDLYVLPSEIRAEVEELSPAELVQQFNALRKGLDPTELPIIKANRAYREWHRRWTYVAAGIGVFGIALASGAWFALGARTAPRERPQP